MFYRYVVYFVQNLALKMLEQPNLLTFAQIWDNGNLKSLFEKKTSTKYTSVLCDVKESSARCRCLE